VKAFAADLHVHTGLSPCAAEEMTPPAIVQAAVERGLAMIAICDHNAAGNARATIEAARRAAGFSPGGATRARGASGVKLTVIAGMEITTAEEVHVVGLFPGVGAAEAAAEEVRATLPDGDEAYTRRFGGQRVMDADGRVVAEEPKMLAAASGLDLSAAVALVKKHGGVAVAAHVNRRSFSVFSQLGLFPADAGFDALEVFTPCLAAAQPAADGPSGRADVRELRKLGLPMVASSDSHFLADIGRARSVFEMEAPTFEELVLALRGVGGRRVTHA